MATYKQKLGEFGEQMVIKNSSSEQGRNKPRPNL
jgi:hypothetical protein